MHFYSTEQIKVPSVLHNFTKCFSGNRVNLIVNKCLNDLLPRCFSAPLKMFTKLLLDKEIDDRGNRQ